VTPPTRSGTSATGALVSALMLAAGLAAAAAESGSELELPLRDLLDNASSFDGRSVALQGTVDRLQAHVTRKGNWYYTFQLGQGGRDVLVAVQERPICRAGAIARVTGRFDGPKKRVDATTVSCD
jgi:hypothetical protein